MEYEYKIVTASENETEEFAERIAGRFRDGDIVALRGDLGAGKTVFVRGAAKYFKAGDVSSPSYALVHEYKALTPKNGVTKILHLDMYRIKSWEDFLSIGFDDLYGDLDGGSIIFIEWYEVIEEFFPDANIFVNMKNLDDGRRQITVKSGENIFCGLG